MIVSRSASDLTFLRIHVVLVGFFSERLYGEREEESSTLMFSLISFSIMNFNGKGLNPPQKARNFNQQE